MTYKIHQCLLFLLCSLPTLRSTLMSNSLETLERSWSGNVSCSFLSSLCHVMSCFINLWWSPLNCFLNILFCRTKLNFTMWNIDWEKVGCWRGKRYSLVWTSWSMILFFTLLVFLTSVCSLESTYMEWWLMCLHINILYHNMLPP